jgi:hypothetical protein
MIATTGSLAEAATSSSEESAATGRTATFATATAAVCAQTLPCATACADCPRTPGTAPVSADRRAERRSSRFMRDRLYASLRVKSTIRRTAAPGERADA